MLLTHLHYCESLHPLPILIVPISLKQFWWKIFRPWVRISCTFFLYRIRGNHCCSSNLLSHFQFWPFHIKISECTTKTVTSTLKYNCWVCLSIDHVLQEQQFARWILKNRRLTQYLLSWRMGNFLILRRIPICKVYVSSTKQIKLSWCFTIGIP